jgi:hypothetical protein
MGWKENIDFEVTFRICIFASYVSEGILGVS